MAVRTKTGAAAAKTAETEAPVKKTNTKTKAKTYTKEQILRSDVYRYRRDLVGALLEGGKSYEIKEVDNMIENYLNGGK